jgi:phosphoserine/homoserine phosphotransferase
MLVACLDLEGVLVPEIWINVAERTGIAELRRTTRDEPDYDKLMRGRIAILDRHGLKLADIQQVIGTMDPLGGAGVFLGWLREHFQVMRKLGWPTLFCNTLEIDATGRIAGYRLRQPDGKKKAVAALHALEYRVIAAGDSYNDTAMLAEAEAGILFRPPDNVIAEFPQFPVTRTYAELRSAFERAAAGL